MRIRNKELLDPDEILADSISVLGSPFDTEGKLEKSISSTRTILFVLLMVLGLGYLWWNSINLQFKNGGVWFAKSQENRFLVRPIIAPRGIIYDRNNKPLVTNEPSWGLVFVKDSFLAKHGDLYSLINNLQEAMNQPSDYFFELGFPEDYNVKKIPAQIFMPQDISLANIVSVAGKLDKLPGVEVFESTKRVYKSPEAGSHLLGFVGKISAEDLKKDPSLSNEAVVGKSGLESYFDSLLRGRSGKKLVEVNATGKETRFKFIEEPEQGSDLHLTIDGDFQKKAYELMQHYTGGKMGGSLVAVDPRDGSILSLVSFPGFDSNNIGYGISKKDFEKVIRNPLKPLFNRAVAGEFPSGSIIKPLTASAALQEKIIDPEKKIYDPGYLEIPNPYKPGESSIYLGWRPHGWINFYDAIALSANVYFYIVGGGYKDQQGLGIYRIKKYLQDFGLGIKTGIKLPGEKSGFLPDPETKKSTDPNNPIWRIGDTYNVSIGQGGLKVTPLQMAMAAAAIVNGGKLYQPRLLDKDPQKLVRENIIDSENLKKVMRGMRESVTDGTSRGLSRVVVPVAAKTGTAQVTGDHLPHSWVMTFAPYDKPEIAMVVMVEYGGEGASTALPIARDLYDWYFDPGRKRDLSTP